MDKTNEKQPIVKIEGLYKKYRKAPDYAIKDINITCNAGEIVGLLGKNGTGKSTTIKCLTGYFPFDKGSVSICGFDIRENPIEAKRNLGYVPDNQALFEKMTGLEYINFIADLHKTPIEERKGLIAELQSTLGLGDKINDIISSYSHGMRQKVCIIASLVHQPKLWLLDEPMIGLDPPSLQGLREYMTTYKSRGNTVLFSSHNLDTVEKICDRAYIIRNGRIVRNIDLAAFAAENSGKSFEQTFIGEFAE